MHPHLSTLSPLCILIQVRARTVRGSESNWNGAKEPQFFNSMFLTSFDAYIAGYARSGCVGFIVGQDILSGCLERQRFNLQALCAPFSSIRSNSSEPYICIPLLHMQQHERPLPHLCRWHPRLHQHPGRCMSHRGRLSVGKADRSAPEPDRSELGLCSETHPRQGRN